MILSDKEKELIHELIKISREKGYKEEEIEVLLMLSCCEPMEDNYGNQEKALEKLIEIVKTSDTSEQAMSEALTLTGFET